MDKELQIYKDDLEKGEYLQSIMIARATHKEANEEEYKTLRTYFMDNKKDIVPEMVRKNRDFNQFWEFISHKFGTYAERRRYIYDEFSNFLELLEEEKNIPHSENVEKAIKSINSHLIENEWAKALDRKKEDPDGAITIARSLLESVLKHILDDLNIKYDKEDLPQLYKMVSKELKLYPGQHEEESFKKILGSCSNIINELSNIRNIIGDAHGKGRKSYRPLERHAELVVNLSGTMSLFLIKTLENNNK